MKTISVDVYYLAQVFGFDPSEFEPGHTYPLLKLTDAIGSVKGLIPTECKERKE